MVEVAGNKFLNPKSNIPNPKSKLLYQYRTQGVTLTNS